MMSLKFGRWWCCALYLGALPCAVVVLDVDGSGLFDCEGSSSESLLACPKSLAPTLTLPLRPTRNVPATLQIQVPLRLMPDGLLTFGPSLSHQVCAFFSDGLFF
jgi:hypothetical protein